MTTKTEDQWDIDYTEVASPSGETYWTHAEASTVPMERVWSVLEDGDVGNLYIVPGYRTVSHLGYIVTEESWTEEDLRSVEYIWYQAPEEELDTDADTL